MSNLQIRLSIPLLVVAAFTLHCWIIFFTTSFTATWNHYFGLIIFFPTVYLLFAKPKFCLIYLGCFLLLAVFNVIAFRPEIITSWVRIGTIDTPPVQLMSLGIFVVYFILNIDMLFDWHLDFKKRKQNKTR